jgi:hypothetical protein
VLIEISWRRRVVGAETFPNDRVPTLDLIRAASILSNGKETLLNVRWDCVDGLDVIDQTSRLRHGRDEGKLVVRSI